MRLHSRVYLHSILVLVVVGAATSLVFAMVNRTGPMREMGERIARHTARVAAEHRADPATLTRRLERLHADLDLDVTVRDLDGRVLAAAGMALPQPPDDALAAARKGDVVARPRPMPYALAPMRDTSSGAIVGTVEVSSPRRFGPPALARPLLFVVVVLIGAALVTRPLARRLSRPLERLTEAARRLGRGDLAARAPVLPSRRWWRGGHVASDEMVDLTRAFNEMAERVERLVSGQKELLANVSHELRSPLARIRMALALLPRDATRDARLGDVERDLTELERLIEDVLAMARLDVSGFPARLGEVDVRTMLSELAERARHDPLVTVTAARVAEGPPLRVIADEALLRRALWNLLENAAKYGAAPVVLGGEVDASGVRLSVTDSGPGIPAASRQRVFEPFYRLDAARTPGEAGPAGFGLGLTFARRVAEVHGGSISVGPASTAEGVERGCRVVITLPVR